jgi:hypothetical protein
MTLYVRGANPIWYFVDLVGNQLNDQFWISYLSNDLPYLPYSPPAVFQDPAGTIPWNNPIQFYPNGTLPDNIYLNSSLVYRLEIRQGPTQSSPLIYAINNYMVGNGGGMTPTNLDILTADNQISNPQFSVVNFVTPPSGSTTPQVTFTTAGIYNIAPGWQLVLSGTGICILTQLVLSQSALFPNNPPYALQINSNGFTTCQLIQTLRMNGGIWASGAIGMSILANAVSSPQMVTFYYQPSSTITGGPTEIFSGLIQTTGFAQYGAFVDVNPFTNTDLSTVAYVQIIINLPGIGEVQLTNIQLMGQDDPLPFPLTTVPEYQQQTNERELDHLAHYYDPQLAYKPIPSYLVGWDFPLNPAQFGTSYSSLSGANASFYTWDQTIIFQSVSSGVSVSRGLNGSLSLAASSTTQMAIMQYLPQSQARELLTGRLSVNLAANAVLAANPNIPVTISLWYTANGSLPSTVGANNSFITALGTNGLPTVVSGWKQVPRLIGEDAIALVTSQTTDIFADYNFNGWSLSGSSDASTATFFAIVVGTASVSSGDALRILSVGLMSGDIGTRPAPQKSDEVLRECQYYLEKSYEIGVVPGSVTSVGIRFANCPLSAQVSSGFVSLFKNTFELQYMQTKQSTPIISFYSSAGTAANVSMGVYDGNGTFPHYTYGLVDVGISNWTALQSSSHNAIYQPNNNTVIHDFPSGNQGSQQGVILYHYVVDSRLGQ